MHGYSHVIIPISAQDGHKYTTKSPVTIHAYRRSYCVGLEAKGGHECMANTPRFYATRTSFLKLMYMFMNQHWAKDGH
jgi:hypothetical protein